MPIEDYPDSYRRGDLLVFGGSEPGAWGGPDDPDPVSRAARVQDQVARFVRQYLRTAKVTQTDFAAAIGIPRTKLNRLLRGQEWARLHEIERMLGGCGHTMTSVSWAIGDGRQQPAVVQNVIATYLHEQLGKLGEGSARIGPAHPSTPDLPR